MHQAQAASCRSRQQPCFFRQNYFPDAATKRCYHTEYDTTVTVVFGPLSLPPYTGGHPSFRTPSEGRLLAARSGAAVATRCCVSQASGRALDQGRIQASVREGVDKSHQDRCCCVVLGRRALCPGGWWRSWGRRSAKENESLMFFFVFA